MLRRLPVGLRIVLLIWRSSFILLDQSTNTYTLFHIQPPATGRRQRRGYSFINTNWHTELMSLITAVVMMVIVWSVFVHQRTANALHILNKSLLWWTCDYHRKTLKFVCLYLLLFIQIPVDACGTCRLWGIESRWCQSSSGALCKSNSGERVVAGRASRNTPPTSGGGPVIGWGFEVGSQRQNDPHYRFQITINNVYKQKGNICPSIMNYTWSV